MNSKFTVNFGPKTAQTLKELADEQEAPQTEIVRRAIGLYAKLAEEAQNGNTIVLRDPEGNIREIVPT